MPDELNNGQPTGNTEQVVPAAIEGQQPTETVQTESPNADNIRQLRENYESSQRQLKEYEPYRALGKPDELKASHEFYNKHWSEARTLAQRLGFRPENLAQAWVTDPVATLAYMREQEAKANATSDPRVLSDRAIAEARRVTQEMLGPIQEREAVRRSDEASFHFDTTWQDLFGKAFPDEATRPPQEFAEELYNLTADLIKDDTGAIKNLLDGKTSDIQKYFDQAKGRLLKLVAKYGQSEQKRIGNQTPPSGKQNGAKKRPTLDELFEKPELANPKYAERV